MAGYRILNVGYYGKNNIGDDLFQRVIAALWPNIEWTFADKIPNYQDQFDAVIFGPGDFLLDPPPGAELNPRLMIGFLGIGFEPSRLTKAWHKLLERARFCVTRDIRAQGYYNALQMPDLAFAMRCFPSKKQLDTRTITILLNENFAPNLGAPEWKTKGWEWFLHEFAGACDQWRREDWELNFVPMQISPKINDNFAAAGVISKMECRGTKLVYGYTRAMNADLLKEMISASAMVVSARLHGSIFASQMGTPFVPLIGHDKMRQFCDDIKYNYRAEIYGARKKEILSAFDGARFFSTQPLLDYSRKAYEQWHSFAGTLMDKFFG